MGVRKTRRYCPEDDAMVLAEQQTPNHILHLLLTLVTVGVWIIVWLLVSLPRPALCPHCGAVTKARPPRGWRPRRTGQEDYQGHRP